MRADRQDSMEKYILEKQNVTIDKLCNEFKVSKNTVRRDLDELVKRGTITKVYGGVAALRSSNFLPAHLRGTSNKQAKQQIGEIAARLVEDGDTIFLDSGTTAPNMVPYLHNVKNLTIITHSLTVMNLLAQNRDIKLMAIGGQYNPDTNSYFGPESLEMLESLHILKAFVGCSGLTIAGGITNLTYYEPILKSKVIERSNKVILITDSSKFGHNATRSVCQIDEIDILVSEQAPPNDIKEYCQTHGIQLINN